MFFNHRPPVYSLDSMFFFMLHLCWLKQGEVEMKRWRRKGRLDYWLAWFTDSCLLSWLNSLPTNFKWRWEIRSWAWEDLAKSEVNKNFSAMFYLQLKTQSRCEDIRLEFVATAVVEIKKNMFWNWEMFHRLARLHCTLSCLFLALQVFFFPRSFVSRVWNWGWCVINVSYGNWAIHWCAIYGCGYERFTIFFIILEHQFPPHLKWSIRISSKSISEWTKGTNEKERNGMERHENDITQGIEWKRSLNYKI